MCIVKSAHCYCTEVQFLDSTFAYIFVLHYILKKKKYLFSDSFFPDIFIIFSNARHKKEKLQIGHSDIQFSNESSD